MGIYRILLALTLILLIYTINEAQALEVEFGLGTPIVFNGTIGSDAYGSDGNPWDTGDVVGMFNVSHELSNGIRAGVHHYSLLFDTHDYGITLGMITWRWY